MFLMIIITNYNITNKKSPKSDIRFYLSAQSQLLFWHFFIDASKSEVQRSN